MRFINKIHQKRYNIKIKKKLQDDISKHIDEQPELVEYLKKGGIE